MVLKLYLRHLSAAGKLPVVTEDDMLRKIINESSEPGDKQV